MGDNFLDSDIFQGMCVFEGIYQDMVYGIEIFGDLIYGIVDYRYGYIEVGVYKVNYIFLIY